MLLLQIDRQSGEIKAGLGCDKNTRISDELASGYVTASFI